MGRKKSEYMEDEKEWSEKKPKYLNLKGAVAEITYLDKNNELIPDGLEQEYKEASLYLSALVDKNVQVKNPTQFAAAKDLLSEVMDKYEKNPGAFFAHHERKSESYEALDMETYYYYMYKKTPLPKRINFINARQADIPLYQGMNSAAPVLRESKNVELAKKEQELFDLYHSADEYNLRKLDAVRFLKALAIRKTATDRLDELMKSPEYVNEVHSLAVENLRGMLSIKAQAAEYKDKVIQPNDVKKWNTLNNSLNKTYDDYKRRYGDKEVFLYNTLMTTQNNPITPLFKNELSAINKECRTSAWQRPDLSVRMFVSKREKDLDWRSSIKYTRIKNAIDEADKNHLFTQYAEIMCNGDGKPLTGKELNDAARSISDRYHQMEEQINNYFEFDHRDGQKLQRFDAKLEIRNMEYIGKQKESSLQQQEEKETYYEKVVKQIAEDERDHPAEQQTQERSGR